MAPGPRAHGDRSSPASPTERHASGIAAPSALSDVFAAVEPVADAVLYEGYLLYPYRRSSVKNRGPRWQFGVLLPPGAVADDSARDTSVAGSVESWFQQTECLLEPARDHDAGLLGVRLRFLQLQHKSVERLAENGMFEPVPQLEIGDRLYLEFEEALPRQIDVHVSLQDLLGAERGFAVEFEGGETVEPLVDASAGAAGRIVRRVSPVHAMLRLRLDAADAPFPLFRLRVRVENTNTDVLRGTLRDEALRSSLVATHTLIATNAGHFVSLLDPPIWAEEVARTCANIHTFPVLAGESNADRVMLSSPIILYDHPQIAPETPGDLFDATEIDEILSLRTLTLSDDEKREARATDPKAAEIVDRIDAMPPQMLAKLHGAVRSLRQVGTSTPACTDDPNVPWWDPGADASVHPETDAVIVGGKEIRRGTTVRLHPRTRGTDAHDMFLAGRIARVEAVFLDVDDSVHVAVTIDADPGAELHEWYGRYHYFRPEEIEAVDEISEPAP